MVKEDTKKETQDLWRLHFHLMPETGWLNDPNGVVQKDGVYHVYHQYVPDDPNGGQTHWGHKTSRDLVHFTEEEIFLSPDQPFDRDGVYSGSALVKDGQIHFFYTGNVKELPGEYLYYGRKQHTVHVVSDNGFKVLRREVVIDHEDYPEGFTEHIRDPNVFEKNGQFYMLLGARTLNHTGSVLLYTSSDLEGWTYQGPFIEGDNDQGYMFECPDFFETDEADVLILSPQGIEAQDYAFQARYNACYLLGQVDWDNGKFEQETSFKELDRGFDFYAPQSFTDEAGDQILWAWMGAADSSPEFINPTVQKGWQHALTMPRVLTVEEGQLKQRPHEAYQQLRENWVEGATELEAERFDDLAGEVYELKLDFENVSVFTLKVRQDTTIHYEEGLLTLAHGYSGYGRRKRTIELTHLSDLHLFSDTSSLELFVNDGDYVMTTRVYPEAGADRIAWSGKGQVHYQKWDLKPANK